ncbi:nucleoside diphosphate kinase regulator [soil metagenome]
MNALITNADRCRINSCIDRLPSAFRRSSGIGSLIQRMRRAAAIEPHDIPSNYVTMNTHVRLRYYTTGEIRDLRLVYPNAPLLDGTDPVSVISPVGAALLGAQTGDIIEWKAPDGLRQGEVLAILYQPEANGDSD